MSDKTTQVKNPENASVKAEEKEVNKEVNMANGAAVPWPQDEYGVSTVLRKEIVRAAGRVNGDKAKAAVIVKHLELGIEHVKARFAEQKAANASVSPARKARLDREKEIAARKHANAVKEAEAQLARLTGKAPEGPKVALTGEK